MVGGAVARDLAGVAQGNATLTPAKTAALARIGLIAQTSDGRTVVTDDGVAFLPKALRKQIEAEPDKFGVMVTAGNSADIARGLLEQGRRIIAGRTGTVAKQQAAAITQAIAPQATAAPAAQNQGATATFAVTVKGKTKTGNATQTYPAIVADDAAGAEKEARRRAASVGITVETADVELVSAETNETPETPQQQGTPADENGERPAPTAEGGAEAQGAAGDKESVKAGVLALAKSMIRADIASGTVPAGVRSFEELQSHADANLYVNAPEIGALGKSLGWKNTDYIDFTNELIAELDRWLPTIATKAEPAPEATPAPKAEKPAKPAKPEPTPEELTRRKFEAAFKKAMAGDKSAKSFGALNVKIVRGAALPADKWIGANKTAAGKFSLLFNSENAAALFPGKTDAEITTLVETAIGEELIHLAQFEVLRKEWDGKGQPGDFNKYVTAFYTKLFNTLDTATKEAVRKIYGGNLGDWQLSAEGVRQLVQLRKDGKLTEQFVKQFTDHLRAIVDFLKSMLGKAAAKSDMLAKAVTDTEAMLAEIEGAVVEKVVETPKPAKKKAPKEPTNKGPNLYGDAKSILANGIEVGGVMAEIEKAAEKETDAVKAEYLAGLFQRLNNGDNSAIQEFRAYQDNAPSQTPAPEAPKLTDIQQEIKDAFGDFLAAPSPDMAARDAEYMAAVERGDMAAARKIFAKAAPDAADNFRINNDSEGPNEKAFTPGKITVEKYGEDPYVYRDEWADPKTLEIKLEGMSYENVVKMPTTQSYIEFYRNGFLAPPADVVIQKDSKKLKSTSRRRVVAAIEAGIQLIPIRKEIGRVSDLAVTRDDAGNVIPLSQRFNPASDSMLYAPSPAQSYDEVLPVDRLAQIVGLSQSLVSKGVKTPEALAENLTALGPKAVSFSQRLWQLMHGFGAEGPLQPDWQAIYAPKATPESVNSEQSSEPTGTAEVSNDTAQPPAAVGEDRHAGARGCGGVARADRGAQDAERMYPCLNRITSPHYCPTSWTAWRI